MSDTVISVENLSKQYRLGTIGGRTLRNDLARAWARLRGQPDPLLKIGQENHGNHNGETIWALRDVSFEVKQGDVVGIIGRNGVGKSTLLKILSRITAPTAGQVKVKGRVASLLEVGTGFHPELTGRENIYLNGAILGMRRAEIDHKFDEIVDFAEVEKFIDTPVKRYSSGMYVRLAFAVAAYLEPEILVVDEVLAVGDVAFQKKCLGKIGDVARGGRTILFVSHNMGAISELCNQAILLHQGQEIAQGKVANVLEAYSRLNYDHVSTSQDDLPMNPSLPCSIVRLRLCNGDGVETRAFDIGEEIVLTIIYRVTTHLEGLQVTVTLARNIVDVIHSFDTDRLKEIPPREPGLYQTQYTIPKMFLKAGIYSIRVTAGTSEWLIQDLESALGFEVEERSINTQMRGYRRDRPGHVISPGVWQTARLE